MQKQKIELLSPAGSYEAFEAALAAGADAVYVGGSVFGARAYARNFTEDELIRAIKTAHIHGRKLYLTVNTLLKNLEIKEQLYRNIAPLYEAGLDAVIVQDFGVFQFIKNNFPELHLHASTQMTVTGPEGMKFLEKNGASRVVAARELSLEELNEMHRAGSIEIEAFVHGALCYSFSGQCLMSSILGGRSGNRGRCAQPCRLPYHIADAKDHGRGDRDVCPLSLKDICTLDILPEIIRSGVTSLKIEGRMKQPSYTAGVTAIYRKYLDLFLKDNSLYRVDERDRQYLIGIFNRGGSCEGYYHQHNGSSMMAFSNTKKSTAEPVLPEKIKKEINGVLTLVPGNPAELNIFCENGSALVSGGVVQEAKEHPMDEQRIRKQMDKMGGTEFIWKELQIHISGSIFVPVSMLNELRRNACEALEEKLCVKRSCVIKSHSYIEPKKNDPSCKPRIYASCETMEQAEETLRLGDIIGIYVNYNTLCTLINQHQTEKELYLMLPHVVRGDIPQQIKSRCEKWLSEGLKGFLVRNLESYAWLKSCGWEKYAVMDSHMYTWNEESISFWDQQGYLRLTAPLELNSRELSHRTNFRSEMVVYGYIPMMISAQCVQKNMLHCDRKGQKVCLQDRYNKKFTALSVCDPWKTGNTDTKQSCYSILYNSLPLGLLKECEQVKNLGMHSLRLSFTLENKAQTREVLNEFCAVYLHGKQKENKNFTKGHFKRGAE